MGSEIPFIVLLKFHTYGSCSLYQKTLQAQLNTLHVNMHCSLQHGMRHLNNTAAQTDGWLYIVGTHHGFSSTQAPPNKKLLSNTQPALSHINCR